MTFEEFTEQYAKQRSFENILKETGELKHYNTGNSMMPLLREHQDILVIKRHEGRLRLWDVPLFKRHNAPPERTYIMHRVLWVGKSSYVICGDNQWRLEFGVKDSQILGVLDTVIRRDKQGNVEENLVVRSTPEHLHVPLKYRIYVAVWCLGFPIRCPYLFVTQTIKRCLYYHRRGLLKKKLQQKILRFFHI